MKRREFLHLTLAATPFLAYGLLVEAQPEKKAETSGTAKPEESKKDADIEMVKESDPMPKSLNYCESADKGKGKVCPNRKEPARATQYCENCQFFTSVGTKGKDTVGKCQILQNKGVKAKGWCNTWAKKA